MEKPENQFILKNHNPKIDKPLVTRKEGESDSEFMNRLVEFKPIITRDFEESDDHFRKRLEEGYDGQDDHIRRFNLIRPLIDFNSKEQPIPSELGKLTVQGLINKLEQIKDKTKPLMYYNNPTNETFISEIDEVNGWIYIW